MNMRLYSCILFCALPYLTSGGALRTNNALTCIELCTGCDGIATFENGYCECQIDNDNKKGTECVNRMRRQGGELGMDLVSCDELGGDRRARCLLASRRRFADADLVAKYFMNGGALSALSPFALGSNSLIGASNAAEGSYNQIGTNNNLMSAPEKAKSSLQNSNHGQESVVGSQSSKSSGMSPIVSQTHQSALPGMPLQSVAMNNPSVATSNMQFGNALQHMIGAANPWSGPMIQNALGNPLANSLGNPMGMLGQLANPNALIEAGAAMLNPHNLQAMSNMLLGLGNVPGSGMMGTANPMAASGHSLGQQMVGATHEDPNQTNMVGSVQQNMVGNAPLGATCLGSSHPHGSDSMLGASNANQQLDVGELHQMQGHSFMQNPQLGAAIPSYAFNAPQFNSGNPQLGAGIPSYAFSAPDFDSGNLQFGTGIPSFASNIPQFRVGNSQLGFPNFQNQPMPGYNSQYNSFVGASSGGSSCADQSSIVGQSNQNSSLNKSQESEPPIVAKSNSDDNNDPETLEKSKNPEKKLKKSLKDSKLGAALSKKLKDIVSAPNPNSSKKSNADKETDSTCNSEIRESS
ncbi:uncharacterized protein LOC107272617 isoform X2 [Cephus cinctus]|uniref:Uncharacterized protein LOC107272617 isoform X2 n=1 Tax=Cephus cinctus TaxID=211228 RepID=A0AAJ7CB45_CEPCN|nr:uncharacterized protein LOC107272617 isoform X2 [Cephus cinctus]